MSDFQTLMKEIETKYQQKWEETRLFESEVDQNKEKFYLIWAYPGVSGYLHIGHIRGYSYLDMIARYKRMRGYNVLFPVGVHASGLPTVGFSLKVKNKEESTINYLLENNCPPELIPRLADPLVAVEYFSKKYISSWKRYGYTCDERYFINTITPEYQKFIQWQFKKLQDLNLLITKPHYAPWCPVDGPIAVDPSETDISEGGDAEQLEFIIVKFKADWIEDKTFFVTGTLRPETVYGVTNIWLNPNETYSLVQMDDEKWIVSQTCANCMKLGDQRKIIDTFEGDAFIGKSVTNIASNLEIPILPGEFVEVDIATGVVMSVPAHAPFDWIALEDIQKSDTKIGKVARNIKPISIIDSPLGKLSAQETCKKYEIQSQQEVEKLKLATEEVYRIEFHKGTISVEEFSGRNISDAKEEITDKLMERGIFASYRIQEFSKKVICRCGNKVSIRMIPEQWFIRYSDKKLKRSTRTYSKSMVFHPIQYKTSFNGIIDWYEDRACARQGKWLGTPLPQDKNWIIEPISDSTLYPIFYIVARYVNSGEITTEELTEEFFDYIFLGEGNPDTISKNLKIDIEKLLEIKRAVDYWYPLDLNLGGKEHQTVHFPVFVMNHIAILKPTFWPKEIFVNYWVVQKDVANIAQVTKLSKSKGGAKPIQDYIVDGIRLYFAHSKSAHLDVEWNTHTMEIYNKHLNKIYDLIVRIYEKLDDKNIGSEYSELDLFLQSKIYRTIQDITKMFDESLNFRKISQEIYYTIYRTLIHYLNRNGNNADLLREVIVKWISLMTPFTPYLAEEFWSMMGLGGFVSNSEWPIVDENQISDVVEEKEEYLLDVIADINKILKMMDIKKINTIEIVITSKWKEFILNAYRSSPENLISEIMKENQIREHSKLASQYAKKLLKNKENIPYSFDRTTEFDIIQDARNYIETVTNTTVKVVFFEETESPKRNQAEPFRPAIYVY
ncbi:leucine--tRNA ligase [Candidatus Heimdallarchaeota archaeon]|nr:MAG: leucine--tRNA ligase [Candidatus Heimdallarchaeota archaeon]